MSNSILVISDSHNNITTLTTALKWAQEQAALNKAAAFNAAVFLGDGYEDLALASARADFSLPWYAVRGNGDYNFSTPDIMSLEVSSRKLFLTHGNRYNVRENYKSVAAAAQNAGAEAALFGHTHIPYCETVNGIFLLNPGSIGRPRSGPDCTFAVLDCPGSGPLTARFFKVINRGMESRVERW